MFFKVENYATLQKAIDELCAFLSERNVHPDSLFDCKLVAMELLGNVLRHADGKADFYGEIKDGVIELKIVSKTVFPFPEKTTCAGVYSEHGRGLFLVKEVCGERIFNDKDGEIRAHILIKTEK